MQLNNIKNTIIIFVGESHRDPAAVGLIKHYIEKFHQAGIPQIFCAELPHDRSLKSKNDIESKTAETNSSYVDFFSSLAERKQSLIFPYFSIKTAEKMKSILQSHLHLSNEDSSNTSDLVMFYLNTLENLQLNKLLNKLQIPYQGIEQKVSEYSKFNQEVTSLSTKSNHLIIQNEKERIEGMVQRLFEQALPLLNNNHGIVWVNSGATHIQNLAAVTLKYIQENSLNLGRSFTMLPIACFSEYGDTEEDNLIDNISLMRKPFNNTKYADLYNKLAFHMVTDVKEEGKHQYKSKKFSELMDFAKASFQKSNIFHIPEWNAEKQLVVEKNRGKVLNAGQNHATISIASEILLNPLREVLGIDRSLITISPAYFAQTKTLLENEPTITVEPLPNPIKLLVTYPKAQEKFVASVVKGKAT